MTAAYYSDNTVTLYHGDCREVLPTLDVVPDCVVADPPYGETALAWDRWPDGWPAAIADVTSSLWCFGSMRMFLAHRDEFTDWRMSQDVVWHKHTGSGFATDRFKRVHEHATHWYRGPWAAVHTATPRVVSHGPHRGRAVLRRGSAAHTGTIGAAGWEDDGTRIQGSVLHVQSMRGRALHPAEKPLGVLRPLIEYACPPGGLVLDPFAGSGSTAAAARLSGRRTVLIESDVRYCDVVARRLSQDVLPIGGAM